MEIQKIQERIDKLFKNQIDQNDVKEFIDLVDDEISFYNYRDKEDALKILVDKQKEEVATFKCPCGKPDCESEPNRLRNLNFLENLYHDYKFPKA